MSIFRILNVEWAREQRQRLVLKIFQSCTRHSVGIPDGARKHADNYTATVPSYLLLQFI